VNEALKPYLARSFGLHAAAVAAFLFLAPRAGLKTANVYTIDFIGPSVTLASAAPAGPAPSAPAKPADEIPAQTDPDAIAPGRHGPAPLPRPSLLTGAQDKRPTTPASPDSLAGPGASKPDSAAPATGGSAAAGAGVTTDLPNFPYPWYISQVRLMLWQSWQRKMPALDAEGAVGFSVLPNGSYTDLQVESSSGDAGFDRAAMAAVEAAAPFPPLPRDFHEPFLKIHLALKAEVSWR